MATQPSYRPLRESAFFADRRASRPPVPGTVARGSKIESGSRKLQANDWAMLAGMIATANQTPLANASRATGFSFYLDTFPELVTLDMLQRGQQSFDIYCSVCHDRVGTGRGMIVQRGFTPPPSLHTDFSRGFRFRGMDIKLTEAPVGYYFDVITNGFGAMPDYAAQVAPKDRWAIIAYIRVLQFSQRATLTDVQDAAERQRLQTSREAQP